MSRRFFFPKKLGVALAALLFSALLCSCGTGEGGAPVKGPGPPAPPEAARHPETLGEPVARRTDFQIPASVVLCGESLPLDRPAVRERLEYEFLLAVNHPAQVELWRRRALRFFPLIEKTLAEAGLPDDLKYLAVAESDLRPLVVSPAGASGLWQFIPSTARAFGLKVGKEQDQRLLPELLLPAGVKYLSSLHKAFGGWALAMAAYNAGEARISGALSSQKGRDYYELNLPRETERYVYRIAAIKLVLEGAPLFGFNAAPPAGLYRPPRYREETVNFAEAVSWTELAERYKTDYRTLKVLNPHLASRGRLSGGPYLFRLPAEGI
ncbi:MAG: lytic transglycosylase domain-containing protein [Deltaproteobacteria bacterium]|jgi:hypothetical protein|nr:lytic transglycosylase domain-containing protein [Deltaproteobacteria bacterium]